MPHPSVDSYPLYDYWPFTHMQAWNPAKYRAFLIEFSKMDGKPYNSSTKTEFMHNLKTSQFYEPTKELTEEELSVKWDKYVSLIYYLGIGRTDRKKFELSEVAKHFFVDNNDVIGLLREQMLKFQYPHGSLKSGDIEMLKAHNKKILPFVFVLQILNGLAKQKNLEEAHISKGELLTLIEKANENKDADKVISAILENRKQNKRYDLSTLPSRVLDIHRLFSFFAGTGLLEFDNKDEDRTIYLKNSNQLTTIQTVLSAGFSFFDFSEREQWIKYYQSLSSSYKKIPSLPEKEAEAYKSLEKQVNFQKLLETVDTEDITNKTRLHPIDPPNKIKISRIITNVSERRWLLPYFQRYFDWEKKGVKEFLESIFKDYYAGALLLWDIRGREPEFATMPIKGVSTNTTEKIESIILDGQQRITSLYYAIKAPSFKLKHESKPLYFYINFGKFFTGKNQEEIIEFHEEKLDRETSFKRFLFPFYELERHTEWTNEFEDYLVTIYKNQQDKIRKLRQAIDKRLNHIVDGFEIPYISLPESMDLTQVTDIFERINTMGKPLSVFDLLIARLSKFGIKLRDLWEDTLSKYPKIKDYYQPKNQTRKIEPISKLPIYIIQSILLYYDENSECKRESQLNVYQNIFEKNSDLKFDEVWDDTAAYIEKGILRLENLRNAGGYGVYTPRILPFESVIPILAVLIKVIEMKQNEKAKCYQKLDMWYWSTVFSGAYSQAVDAQLTADYKEMLSWFYDEAKIPETVEKARTELSILDLKKIKQISNAKYKGILAILALEGSRDFDTGQPLENSKNNDKHHLFPKATFPTKSEINSILNMSLMSSDTNKKIIKWKKPSVYIKEFVKEKYNNDDQKFLSVLKTHLINKEALEFLLEDDFEGFIGEREDVLIQKISELMGVKGTLERLQTLISPDTPFSNELAIRKVIGSCKEYVYWVDKYFSRKGLEYLVASLPDKVKNIKILVDATSLLDKNSNKMKDDLKTDFMNFKVEMKNKDVSCELRVIVDNKIRSEIHDRWIITKNAVFNVPSPDIIARGQYSEIKETRAKLPFDKWWGASVDITTGWEQIKRSYEK